MIPVSVLLPLLLSAPAPATGAGVRAAAAPSYSVTFAARECPDYTDIMANRARNNIQESLKDLGKDSVYSSGQPVDPAIEGPHDPNCTPLTGWSFSLGNAIGGGKVDGLSKVTGAPDKVVTTLASTPLLDSAGNSAGGGLAGATTLTLDSGEVQQAQQNRLWVQGGLVGDPLMQAKFGDTYSFGVLRCAVDNANADNVETAAFPSGFRHVFCYYYAVKAPPKSGTIVVRKELNGERDTLTFPFHGNVSYAPGGAFQLSVKNGDAGEISFDRGATEAGDAPWTLQEDPTPGWALDNVSCVSASGSSVSTVTGTAVSVTLATGDTVTCTYRNTRELHGPLNLFKRTIGGVGGPSAMTAGLDGQPQSPVGTVSTTTENVPVLVGSLPAGAPGRYRVTESYPAPTALGFWAFNDVQCNGVDEPTGDSGDVVEFFVDATTQAQNCLVTNVYTPRGSLRILKTTYGGTTTTAFQVEPLHGSAASNEPLTVSATTTEPGKAVLVTGAPLDRLAAGQYVVTELEPPATATGHWVLTDATCNSLTRRGTAGSVIVSINERTPAVECHFHNRFVRYGTLNVVKNITDPDHVRTGPVTITVDCTDGTRATLTVAAGSATTGTLPDPLVFPHSPTRCTVTETATGAEHGSTVDTRVTVRHNEGRPRTAKNRETRAFYRGSASCAWEAPRSTHPCQHGHARSFMALNKRAVGWEHRCALSHSPRASSRASNTSWTV